MEKRKIFKTGNIWKPNGSKSKEQRKIQIVNIRNKGCPIIWSQKQDVF